MRVSLTTSTLIFLLSSQCAWSDSIKMDVSGQSQDRAELESLSPSPDIPKPDAISFSGDNGKSAIEQELLPMGTKEAALQTDPSHFSLPFLPTIPASPYLAQPLPPSDDPSMGYFRNWKARDKNSWPISQWRFNVIDEMNNELYSSSGTGVPPKVFTWDGTSNNNFVLSPNRTYFSFIVLTSSTGVEVKIPGEGERFLCFERQEGTDQVIYFASRVYKQRSGLFSDEAHIYLMDLKKRLNQLKNQNAWSVNVYEPETNGTLREQRKNIWLDEMKKVFGNADVENNINLHPYSDGGSAVRVILKNFQDPSRPVMIGVTRDPRPQLEDKTTWIKIKEGKGSKIIEMRHDRLFRPGTAYLRDEALPLLTTAFEVVRTTKDKPVLLRSVMEKPKEKKKGTTFEEDPQLAALRSKILFMLMAQEKYLK